jgi:hypothetical protein
MITYTVATHNGNEVARHYPRTDDGLKQAYSHASAFHYEIWESIDGEPRYLIRTAR